MNSRREIHLIVNPVSGRSGSQRIVALLRKQLLMDRCSVTVHETRQAGDCRRFAQQAVESGSDALVVVGGDGTMCEAAGGVHSARTRKPSGSPILVVPSGTENILAKYLDVRGNAERLRQILHDGKAVSLDLALRDRRPFLLVAGIGFDAEVVRRLAEDRDGHISYLSYSAPLWRTFWSYRHPQVSVEADGAVVFEGRGMVFIGNVPRYALGLQLLQKASPFDGLLDLCVFECTSQAGLLRHSLNVLLRRHVGTEGVVYRQARNIRVWSKEAIDVELDGDFAGSLPATFEILPAAVQFQVAANWSPAGDSYRLQSGLRA